MKITPNSNTLTEFPKEFFKVNYNTLPTIIESFIERYNVPFIITFSCDKYGCIEGDITTTVPPNLAEHFKINTQFTSYDN